MPLGVINDVNDPAPVQLSAQHPLLYTISALSASTTFFDATVAT